MVLFPNGDKGMVLNLETSVVKVVLFGSERKVVQGDYVFRTQGIGSIRTGAVLLGSELAAVKQLAAAAAKGLTPVLKNPRLGGLLVRAFFLGTLYIPFHPTPC